MLAVASFERTTTSGALGVVWLGDGREGELSDCAWSKDDAVGAVVLEVAEFLTLRHVVAGLDVGVDDAGGDVTGEPRLQVVPVVRQPTGLPAYIYSIRPSRHELVEARRECDRGDGGNRRLRQRCVAQRPISTPSSPAIGASASCSSLASTTTERDFKFAGTAVMLGLTGAVGGRILKVIVGRSRPARRSGRVMSSEYATEQVPLAEIQEGDTIQDPESGQWFTVTRTADGTTSVTHKHSDGDTTVIEGYRVYYGDERQGEQVDSRCVIDSRTTKGLVTRQVRE